MGQTQIFNEIYKQYYARSYRFVMLYVRDEPIAEDIVVDSLVKLWETMKNQTVDSPPALLLTILKNKSLDYLKAHVREQEVYDSMQTWQQQELQIRISNLDACNPEYVFSKEIQLLVHETLEKLPFQTRRAFEMSRMENKSIKEIAAILEISVKGVDYHIAKALRVLRIALKDYFPVYLIWWLEHN